MTLSKDCKWCKRRLARGDHSDCREKAKDSDCSMPDPECDHEEMEYEGSHGERDRHNQTVSVLEYRCAECGGAFAE